MFSKDKIFAVITALSLSVPLSIFAQKADTLTYTLVSNEVHKGWLKSIKKAPGSYEDWFQYNDRGRGDSLRISYRQDEQGFPVFIHTHGKDYFKKEVTEDFSFVNGKAEWKNNAEQESRPLQEKAFYISLQGTSGNIVKALKSNHNKIKLLPFGEASLKLILQHTIGAGAQARKLWLYSISGLNFIPDYTWIDDQDNFFAKTSDWNSQIVKGYESYIPELISIQKKIEHDSFNKVANELPEKVKGSILIKNVTLFDAEQAKQCPHTDVLISEGRIKAVSIGKPITARAARIIDGSGQTLIPGLWDMHVHFSQEMEGILHLANGVTHVRDMGNNEALLAFRKQIDNGELIGPHIEIISGLIDGTGPFAAPTGILINNVEEGKKAVKVYADKGYEQIKLYSSIKPEWVKPLIAEAKKYNMRVCGHIPAFMTASKAIDAGYDEVTHMNMLLLNFFGDTIDTRSPQRFIIPAERAASLDLNSQEVKQFISLMKAHHTATDPTLATLEPLFVARDGVLEEKNIPIVSHFPVQTQRILRAGGGGLPIPPGMDSTYLKSFDTFLKLTKLLYDSGIRIVAGTDGMPGFDMHRELELYVKAGIPPEKVLQLASFGTAIYTGKSKDLGSISAGKIADMFLVAGDPVKNISDIRNTRLVIRDGVIYDPAKLYRSISIVPF